MFVPKRAQAYVSPPTTPTFLATVLLTENVYNSETRLQESVYKKDWTNTAAIRTYLLYSLPPQRCMCLHVITKYHISVLLSSVNALSYIIAWLYWDQANALIHYICIMLQNTSAPLLLFSTTSPAFPSFKTTCSPFPYLVLIHANCTPSLSDCLVESSDLALQCFSLGFPDCLF